MSNKTQSAGNIQRECTHSSVRSHAFKIKSPEASSRELRGSMGEFEYMCLDSLEGGGGDQDFSNNAVRTHSTPAFPYSPPSFFPSLPQSSPPRGNFDKGLAFSWTIFTAHQLSRG